jgi:hypothetical protein
MSDDTTNDIEPLTPGAPEAGMIRIAITAEAYDAIQ